MKRSGGTTFFISVLIFLGLGLTQDVFAADPHAYFNLLAARADKFVAHSYRTQAEIDADIHGQPDHSRLVYDQSINAAKFIFPVDTGSARQLRPTFPNTSSGNLLFVWEARWSKGWSTDGSVGGLNTHKAFQFSDDGHLNMEVRCLYGQVNKPYVAKVDVRAYQNRPIGPADTLLGQVGTFFVSLEIWTRFWAFIDFSNGTFSLWVADENNQPVVIHNKTKVTWTYLSQFWFEFNSSQERVGPEMYTWGRNFVLLKNITGVDAIVSQGAVVNGGVQPDPQLLAAPKNLKIGN